MGNMFGGGDQGDGGAAERMAEANRQAQRDAQAAADRRWEQQQQAEAQQRESEKQQLAMDAQKREQQIQYDKDNAARQAEALAKTGAPATDFANTRSKQAQAYQAGLTGFDSLPMKKKALVQTPQGQGAFAGQGNLPMGGFNIGNTGGRSYT